MQIAYYIWLVFAAAFIIYVAPDFIGDTVQWGKEVWNHYTKEKSSADGTAEQDQEGKNEG